jgi:hypothetical protein
VIERAGYCRFYPFPAGFGARHVIAAADPQQGALDRFLAK